MSRYEISPRERYDEQVRDFHDFDGPHEDGHSFMPGIDRHFLARLTERGKESGTRPRRQPQLPGASASVRAEPRSVNPDKEAA